MSKHGRDCWGAHDAACRHNGQRGRCELISVLGETHLQSCNDQSALRSRSLERRKIFLSTSPFYKRCLSLSSHLFGATVVQFFSYVKIDLLQIDFLLQKKHKPFPCIVKLLYCT